MKNTILIAGIFVSSMMLSCGNKGDEKSGEGDAANNEIKEDAQRMCDCYKAGLNDSQKYMECSSENEKLRAKYMEDPEKIKQYDIAISECMK